jgi:hypothetical protein
MKPQEYPVLVFQLRSTSFRLFGTIRTEDFDLSKFLELEGLLPSDWTMSDHFDVCKLQGNLWSLQDMLKAAWRNSERQLVLVDEKEIRVSGSLLTDYLVVDFSLCTCDSDVYSFYASTDATALIETKVHLGRSRRKSLGNWDLAPFNFSIDWFRKHTAVSSTPGVNPAEIVDSISNIERTGKVQS